MSKKHIILFVDDEVSVLDVLRRALRGQRDDWNMHFAQSVDEALENPHQTGQVCPGPTQPRRITARRQTLVAQEEVCTC